MKRVVVVDAGGANTGSVCHAFGRLGVDARLSADAKVIRAAHRVVVPGVGNAATVMRRLRELDLVDTMRALGQPVLGICVGMQILFERSEEGGVECLGLLRGRIEKMTATKEARMPHMGWNRIWPSCGSSLIDPGDAGAYAYFVHGFAAPPTRDCIAVAEHGAPFAAAVQRGNFAGVQFHPERSAAFGARVLRRFVEREPA